MSHDSLITRWAHMNKTLGNISNFLKLYYSTSKDKKQKTPKLRFSLLHPKWSFSLITPQTYHIGHQKIRLI